MKKREVIEYVSGKTSLGLVLTALSKKGLCAVLMGDDLSLLIFELETRFPDAMFAEGEGEAKKVWEKVVDLIKNPGQKHGLKLDVRGTRFQQKVWDALGEIPYGTTASYSEIAQKIGSPKAVRAVAGACAANHIAVVIPCHRVVRSDGALSGYRWGVERKAALLKAESK